MGRVKKELKPIQKECDCCGVVFTAFSRQAKYCAECRDPLFRQTVMLKRNNPNKALFALLRKIDKYNRENGTHLSYGKYVDAVYRKQLTCDRGGK